MSTPRLFFEIRTDDSSNHSASRIRDELIPVEFRLCRWASQKGRDQRARDYSSIRNREKYPRNIFSNYTLGKSQNYKVHDNAIIVHSETSREGETNDRKSTLFRSAIRAEGENTDFMNREAH